MTVFNRRNALVGYVALKALKLRRRRRKRSGLRLATFVVLGVLSVGILAALAAVVVRRQREGDAEQQRPAGHAEAESPDGAESQAHASGVVA